MKLDKTYINIQRPKQLKEDLRVIFYINGESVCVDFQPGDIHSIIKNAAINSICEGLKESKEEN